MYPEKDQIDVGNYTNHMDLNLRDLHVSAEKPPKKTS